MATERKPDTFVKSTARLIKAAFAKAQPGTSLKAYAHLLEQSTDGELRDAASKWFRNKRANFSKPPLGMGATRKKKNSQGGKK